ncbi:alpha-ketoglutarate decarboxylase [uncultured Aquimarina sp.]|uniref:alpha-ketoglutarate decarboxylase n=1 Tax=uncultured Aquimarina sp. TaxID=575652 RepID=UPI0026168D3B|nr:alpha-ketoglutarate decarboxylase [uncultured Aquimarina sp.]
MKVFLIQKIKFLILVFLIFFSLQKGYSQDDNFWSRVRIGGNIGIGFTNDTFNGIIAPSAVYDFNNQFSMGFGLNFGYTDSRNFTATNYGASLITLYNPFPSVQLSAEFEQMGVSSSFEIEGGRDIKDDYWYPALFIGAGYRLGFVSVGLRYDVLYDDDKSIYASPYAPFIRVFF